MESIKIKGPAWFPDYVKSSFDGLLLLKEISGEGIYFIEYPTRWAEEIRGLLKSFFTIKNDGNYVGFDESPEIVEDLNADIIQFIREVNFETGPTKYSFKITSDAGKQNSVELLRDGKIFPITNLSHRTVLQSIRASNLLLKENTNFVCFQMDTGCLDIETNKVIYRIFSYLNEKIKNTGKNLIIFYSDSRGEFTTDYLWKPNCYKSFAVIDQDGSYRVLDYDESIKQIKDALEQSNFERIDLFLGAGASIASGLPSGRTLRLIALKELTNNPENDNEEELLMEAIKIAPKALSQDIKKVSLELVMSLLKVNGKKDLTRTNVLKFFEEKHKICEKNPSEGYNLLKKIVDKGILILGVTTNFDQLFEHNIPKPTILIDDSDFESADLSSIVRGGSGNAIIKLHGCRSYPNTLGIELQNISELSHPKKEFMKAYLSSARPEGPFSNVFFIGYNFADLDVLGVLTNNVNKLRIRPIIVNPHLSPAIKSFMNEFNNKTGEATHIPFTFDFFMKVLYDLIRDNRKVGEDEST